MEVSESSRQSFGPEIRTAESIRKKKKSHEHRLEMEYPCRVALLLYNIVVGEARGSRNPRFTCQVHLVLSRFLRTLFKQRQTNQGQRTRDNHARQHLFYQFATIKSKKTINSVFILL